MTAEQPERWSAASERYRSVRAIASGGMGSVELVLLTVNGFQRLYARKRLHAMGDREHRAMFLDEARIAGLLRHPNVVSVLDVGEDAQGPFLIMDYVEGVPLSQVIRAFAPKPPPLSLVLSVGIDVARGLHAAHELKDVSGQPLELVHRDVSPQNLLVGVDGVTRVTDFGVAKAYGRETHTETGVIKGKIGYLSPEQLRFDPVDRRSDLFSLGVVLYEALTGRRLYRRAVDGRSVPKRILMEPAPDLAIDREDAPDTLVELLFALLAKYPEERISTAEEVAETLAAVREELHEFTPPVGVSTFVEEHFAEELAAARDETADAVARLSQRDTAAPPLASRPRLRRRWAVPVALVVLGLGGAAWGVTDTTDSGPPPALAPTPHDVSPAGPPSEATAARTDEVTQGSDEAAADSEAVVDPLPEPDADGPSRPRRRRTAVETAPTPTPAPRARPRRAPSERIELWR